jgi:hypothetical protein
MLRCLITSRRRCTSFVLLLAVESFGLGADHGAVSTELAAAAPLSSWPLLFARDAKKKSLTFHEPVRFVVYEHAAFADPLARRGFQTCTHIAGQLDTEMANDDDVWVGWGGASHRQRELAWRCYNFRRGVPPFTHFEKTRLARR